MGRFAEQPTTPLQMFRDGRDHRVEWRGGRTKQAVGFGGVMISITARLLGNTYTGKNPCAAGRAVLEASACAAGHKVGDLGRAMGTDSDRCRCSAGFRASSARRGRPSYSRLAAGLHAALWPSAEGVRALRHRESLSGEHDEIAGTERLKNSPNVMEPPPRTSNTPRSLKSANTVGGQR